MISVIMATYNGAEVLQQTLDALCRLAPTKEEVEFVIVDNASTDSTQEILAQYQDRLPIVLRSETRQGKSFAIHTGISASSGEYLVFTDNDVIPNEQWLVNYEALFETQPDYGVFMGAIRPHWMKTPPDWLQTLSDKGRAGGCTNLAQDNGPAPYYLAKGANFGIRRDVLTAVSFREDLWIAGKNEVGGEDTDFVKKAVEAGYLAWFSSDLMVKHIIRPDEMTLRYLWRRYVRIGRSMAAIDSQPVSQTSMLLGYPRWVVSEMIKRSIKIVGLGLTGQAQQAATELTELAMQYGKFSQYKRQNTAT